MQYSSINRIVKSSIYLLFSNLLRLSAKFFVQIFSAKILGPTNFGFYNLIDLITKYGPLSNLGVSSGISREIPLNLGKKLIDFAHELNNSGFTGLLISSNLIALLIIVSSIFIYSGLALYAIIMASLSIIVNAIYEYHIMYLYSYNKFKTASFVITIYSLFLIVVTISLVYIFNVWGLFFSIFLVPFLVMLVVYIKKIHLFSFKFDYRNYISIIKIGFPLIIIGIGFTFFITLDRIIIVKLYDIKQLGYYSLAIISYVFIIQIPAAINQVIYPKLNLIYGETNNSEHLAEIAIAPSMILSIVMPLFIGMFIFILPILTKKFLPEYDKGIIPAEIIMIPLCIFSVNILNTLFKIKILIILLVTAICIKIFLALYLNSYGLGIDGIAISSSLSLTFYTIATTVISFIYMKKNFFYIIKYLSYYFIIPIVITLSFFLYGIHKISIFTLLFVPLTYYFIILFRLLKNNLNLNSLLVN